MNMPWYLYALLGLVALDTVAVIIGIIALRRSPDEKRLARYIELSEVVVLINLFVIIAIGTGLLIEGISKLRINPCECGCEP